MNKSMKSVYLRSNLFISFLVKSTPSVHFSHLKEGANIQYEKDGVAMKPNEGEIIQIQI